MAQDLLLDRAIAAWVLFPIVLVMLCVGVLRHYAVTLLHSPPKPAPRPALREQRALMRGQVLRANGRHLSRREYEARREALMVAYTEGTFLKDGPKKEGESDEQAPPPNPLDPAAMDGMIGMLKKQAVMFVPQTVLMGWINLFFSGFVLSTYEVQLI